MKIAHATLTKGAALTLVSSSFGNLICLTTSIILARLLAPELFGVMVLDLFATLLMLVLFAIFVWLRWMLGLGTPFDSVFS